MWINGQKYYVHNGNANAAQKTTLNAFNDNNIKLINTENKKDLDFRQMPTIVLFATNDNTEYSKHFDTIIKTCKDNTDLFDCV